MNRSNNAPISMAENDAMALAAEMFDHFSAATTMRQILGLYRNMCDTIGLRAGPLNEFYPKLKSKIKTWKAQALWKKFDARASHRVYNKGTACKGTRVLVIGAGPCGLRTAIEAQLLGAKVVVVEKRDRISRNNVLHLWPFLITDLRNLGAKKFYGKFCAGSIDHISIRQLQCILLKVALLLGVEVHEGISFEKVIEPRDGCGWRAQMSPEDHAVSHYEFDVLIGADGKRNTLEGFRRKEFRGKLAIAITANFINKKTEAEAKAEEISGVAFIFNQSFFKELYSTTGIDLENIVYYKDETHYFVMTAKKHSLIDKGVIMQDFADPAELLSSANVNTERLLDYAREAAQFSTKYQMPNLEFAVNHYGKPDVAMFDFTSMFAAEISCSAIVRKNYRLLQCLVGDSLLEPFWPTGSGCARGFLSSMDAAYAMKLWNNQRNSVLAVLAQRESIYRLLAQTTPENLHRDIGSYTLDPATRYPNLNRGAVNVHQVKHLLSTDDPAVMEQTFMDSNALTAAPELPTRRKRRTGDTLPLSTVLLRWIRAQLQSHEFSQSLDEVSECFTNGQVLCALINRYRPDLVDLTKLKGRNVLECNDLAFTIIENELMIPCVMTAQDSLTLENIDPKMWLTYLEQICEVFRGEIPHVKHPKLDFAELKDKPNSRIPDFSRLLKLNPRSKVKSPSHEVEMVNARGVMAMTTTNDQPRIRKFTHETIPALPLDAPSRRAKKRRSHEKFGNLEERQRRNQEIEENRQDRQNKRRLQRAQQTQNFYKSLHMLQANTLLRESDSSSPFEDYSIFMYRQSAPEFGDRVKELERKLMYPDRDRGIASAMPRSSEPDYQFNDRIKSMEHKITAKNTAITEKKPKDLLRAIGKIESNDWNIREIEKKIEQSKKTEVGKSREKVPKWSKEQFLQRQNKMARPLDQQGSVDEKFKEIDATIKNFDKQMKDGAILERGQRGKNKVASIAGTFGKKEEDKQQQEDKSSLQRSNSKAGAVFAGQTVSEMCHFCKQKVYLMEKISAEGLILHRACLKCHHCHTSLRLGGYAFDRDDPAGLFYCTQHYRLPAKVQRPIPKRSMQRIRAKTETDAHHSVPKITTSNAKETNAEAAARDRREGIANLDLLNRGQTPERIEFENTDAMSDGEPSLENIIDENEWTDRNFGTGTEDSESDITSTDSSDSGSDEEYEEAMGSPLGAQTLQLATDWIGKQRYSANQFSDEDDDDEFYDSSEDEGADSQTEGEEMDRARQIRMQEVKLKPLPYLPTDTETEPAQLYKNAATATPPASPLINPSNANDIKFLDNKSDTKFTADIDRLNESLYKINNYMKLTKDIDELKKENSVRQDIQRKLSLKEQWLKNNSAPPVPPFVAQLSAANSLRSINSDVDEALPSVSSMTEDIAKSQQNFLNDVERAFSAPKFTSPTSNFQLVKSNSTIEEELFGSKSEEIKQPVTDVSDELDFLDTLELSDREIKALCTPAPYISQIDIRRSQEKQQKEALAKKLRNIEAKNFSQTKSHIAAQMSGPKVSAAATRDVSQYFPKKQEAAAPSTITKNQKDLKSVDLAKYFAPSPVQSRKVFGFNSPMKQSDAPKKPNSKQNSFDLSDVQFDGAMDMRKPKSLKREIDGTQPKTKTSTKTAVVKKKKIVEKKQLPEEMDETIFDSLDVEPSLIERSASKQFNCLFDDEKIDVAEIDQIFAEVAREVGIPPYVPLETITEKKKTAPKKLASQELMVHHIDEEQMQKYFATPMQAPEPKEANLTYNKPAPKWTKKQVLDDDLETFYLSQLSTSLIDQIKELEAQIAATEPLCVLREIDEIETGSAAIKIVAPVVSTPIVEAAIVEKPMVNKPKIVSKRGLDAKVPVTKKKVIAKKKIVSTKKSPDKMTVVSIPVETVELAEVQPDIVPLIVPTHVKVRGNSISYDLLQDLPTAPKSRKNSLAKTVIELHNEAEIPTDGVTVNDAEKTSPVLPKEVPLDCLPTIDIKIAPVKPLRRSKSNCSSIHESPQSTHCNEHPKPETSETEVSKITNGHDSQPNSPKPFTKIQFKYKPLTTVGRRIVDYPVYAQVVKRSEPQKAVIEENVADTNGNDLRSNGIVLHTNDSATLTNGHGSHVNSEAKSHLDEIKNGNGDSAVVKSSDSSRDTTPSRRYRFDDGTPQKPTRRHQRENEAATAALLERSQMIHNQKQEFMNSQRSNGNPYMRHMIAEETRESLYSSGDEYKDYVAELKDYKPKEYKPDYKEYKPEYKSYKEYKPIVGKYTDDYRHRALMHKDDDYRPKSASSRLSKQDSTKSGSSTSSRNYYDARSFDEYRASTSSIPYKSDLHRSGGSDTYRSVTDSYRSSGADSYRPKSTASRTSDEYRTKPSSLNIVSTSGDSVSENKTGGSRFSFMAKDKKHSSGSTPTTTKSRFIPEMFKRSPLPSPKLGKDKDGCTIS